MRTYKQAGGILASVAVVAVALFILASAFTAFLSRQIGDISMLFTVEVVLAGLLFLPAVLAHLADRETLSVYREIRRK